MRFPEATLPRAALAAALITLLVYLPSVTFDAINLDDPDFVLNPAIRQFDLDFVRWAFTNSEAAWWMPLVWISFALDYSLWQGSPAGYHLTNILLHAANTMLVAVIADRILRRVFPRGESALPLHLLTVFLTALFFGIHPVQVESVAWICERKNVLSTFFSLSSIVFYLKYVVTREDSGSQRSSIPTYLLTFGFLLLALVSKPLAVMIPTLFLVVDWYPYGRIRKGELARVLLEKIPFFVVAGAVAAGTVLLASGDRILVPLELFPLADRFTLSGYALFEYCRLLLFPSNMVVLALVPATLPLSYMMKATAVYAGTILSLSLIRRMPWLPAVWFSFLLMHLPSLHFFLNGACSVSSHFLYIPSIFIFLAAGGVFYNVCSKLATAQRRHLLAGIILLVLALAVVAIGVTRHTLAAWKDSGTFWTRMITYEPVGRFYYYRGAYYLDKGDFVAAAADFHETIRIAYQSGHPEVYTLHAFYGEALRRGGRHAEAVREFSTAISGAPLPNFFYYRALSLRAMGRVAEADDDFLRSGGDDSPIIWQYLKNRDDLKPRQGK
jgi:hypothetical protein